MKKIVIIGAGIAGLYMGYQLSKKGHEVIILEKEKSLGGRMFTETVEMEGQVYHLEGGAGVVRDDEKLIIRLLKELKIPVSFWKSKTSILYHQNRNTEVLNYNYTEILENICHYANNDQPFLEAIDSCPITKKEKIGVILGTSYSELMIANGKDTCENNDFDEFLINSDHQYGKPQSWTSLVDRLEKEIIKRNGIIYHETPVLKIHSSFIETKDKEIDFDHLVITCPYHQFKKIQTTSIFDSWKKFMDRYHHETNYLRVYSYFEDDLNIPEKIASNLSIRRVIPISKRMIMSVYTDGVDATHIYQLCKLSSHQELNQLIRKELKMLLGKEIPNIKKNWCYYFYKGISNWNPSNLSVKEMVSKAQEFSDHIHFCGDTYSAHPGWIHGAIESSDQILKKI
jgi:hypothetical protein